MGDSETVQHYQCSVVPVYSEAGENPVWGVAGMLQLSTAGEVSAER